MRTVCALIVIVYKAKNVVLIGEKVFGRVVPGDVEKILKELD